MHYADHSVSRPPLTLIILAAIMLVALGVIGRSNQPSIQTQIDPNEELVEARVMSVIDEGLIDRGDIKQPFQKLRPDDGQFQTGF